MSATLIRTTRAHSGCLLEDGGSGCPNDDLMAETVSTKTWLFRLNWRLDLTCNPDVSHGWLHQESLRSYMLGECPQFEKQLLILPGCRIPFKSIQMRCLEAQCMQMLCQLHSYLAQTPYADLMTEWGLFQDSRGTFQNHQTHLLFQSEVERGLLITLYTSSKERLLFYNK